MRTAVVVGAGLGGLSAAIHLQLAGWQVTLLEANAEPGGRAGRLVRDGFHFDLGPSLLNYPWVFADLFRTAGRRLEDYLTLLPVDPSVAFAWRDGTRLQLSSDFSRLLEEFERLAPGNRAGTVAFFADAAVKYRIAFEQLVTRNDASFVRWIARVPRRDAPRLGLWRSLDRELARFFPSRHIREALGSYAMYLGGSPFTLPGFFSILPYGELAYGLWLPKGGIYALVEALARLAGELGVTLRTSAPVEQINIDNGRATGVRLQEGEVIGAGVVVSNVDVPTTDTQLLAREPSIGVGRTFTVRRSGNTRARQAERTRMTPAVLTFYLGVRGRLDGLGHHTIFLPGDYRGTFDELLSGRVPEDLPFYVSIASATDPALAPPGDSGVFVLAPMPLVTDLPDADWQAIRASARARVLARLAEHGTPIHPSRIVCEAALTPPDWAARCGLFRGSAFGAAHTTFQVGPLRAANQHPRIRGLFYVGAGTTPGTGMPMVLLSGRMVAERVAARNAPARVA